MKFSIIIPTYNEEGEIAATLEAILDVDYPDQEIIVVDDSTDRTPEIVRRYLEFCVEYKQKCVTTITVDEVIEAMEQTLRG